MPTNPNYGGFHRLRGDETHNPVGTLAVLVPGEGTATFARQLHVLQASDRELDLNIAAQANPTLYLHSVTTPITDYVSIGGHDGTTATIDVVGGTTLVLAASGTTQLTMNAIGLVLADAFGIVVGHTAQLTVSDGDGATNVIPELQVTGTGAADGSMLIAAFATANTRAVAPSLKLAKGGASTIAVGTTVADNEVVGTIIAYGDDGGDLETPVASIEFVVDGTPAASQLGGSIEMYTTIDGGTTLTLGIVQHNTQNVGIGAVTQHSTAGTLVLSLFEGTAPSGAMANGSSIFSDVVSTEEVLRGIGSGGTVTTL